MPNDHVEAKQTFIYVGSSTSCPFADAAMHTIAIEAMELAERIAALGNTLRDDDTPSPSVEAKLAKSVADYNALTGAKWTVRTATAKTGGYGNGLHSGLGGAIQLPAPKPTTTLVPATESFPAHFAGPSGEPSRVVFTVLTTGQTVGKKIIVEDGRVVKTKGKTPTATFHTAMTVGAATLEDIAYHLETVSALGGFFVRHPLATRYAPAVVGARRAAQPDADKFGMFDFVGFDDGPSNLIALDIDNLSGPDTLDFTNARAVADHLLAEKIIPAEMGKADMLLSPSSSYGRPHKDGGRELGLRIIAFGDRYFTRKEFERWAPRKGKSADDKDTGSDPAMGRTTQPIFVTRACFEGEGRSAQPAPDPYAKLILTIVRGEHREVQMEIPVRAAAVRQERVATPARERHSGPDGSGHAQDAEPLTGALEDTLAGLGQDGHYYAALSRAAGQLAYVAASVEEADEEAAMITLEEALPDTAIETLEAIRLFVFTSSTAFVVAADEAMIEYSVRKHFPDLPDTTGPLTYARNYLEKLIQVPIRIPALGETETRIYVTLLLVGAELGEGDPQFETLIAAAREKLKKPWAEGSLDAATVRDALGAKAGQAQNALALSDQIGPILASGTKGNPRQIKRFLNTLVLRERMAAARGFGDDVHLPVLAKLMLAERFLPILFDQIGAAAAGAVDGRCAGLASLEAAVRSTPAPKVGAAKGAKGSEASVLEGAAAEWSTSKAYAAWAAVQPEIGNEDLRPYLFVAKDRKDYFGANSVLGHLSSVVEQLLGPKIAVQAMDGDLRKLAPPEAAQVFELLRARIMSAGVFDKEPPGVAGMTVLVKAKPTLQTDLIAFLEGLPLDRLGGWPVSGWEGVFKDAAIITQFSTLRERWAADGKGVLKTTAAMAVRTSKAGPR